MTIAAIFSILLPACNQKEESRSLQNDTVKLRDSSNHQPPVIAVNNPDTFTYHFSTAKQWLKEADFNDPVKRRIVIAINRTDSMHFRTMDTVIIPDDLSAGIEKYLPFPERVTYLDSISKIIFFSYPAQSFAAYEKGKLVYTGPVNMGRKKYPTPSGLYFTNWKSKKSISSVNDEWVLPWNFNIANRMGIGWHQYALPGYPASHSCLRLQTEDARYLYYWADQWVLDNDTIVLKGTPVIVFGEYDFDGKKPWWQLINNPEALNISADDIKVLVEPHFNEIILWQHKKQNQNKYD